MCVATIRQVMILCKQLLVNCKYTKTFVYYVCSQFVYNCLLNQRQFVITRSLFFFMCHLPK